MKNLSFFLILSTLCLGACATMEDLGKDISSRYDELTGRIANTADPVKEAKKKLPVYDGTCPSVSVRPDLQNLVEFYDEARPSDATRVSEITIDSVQNTCRVEGESLVMQIDINLSGKTGPKARSKPTDVPSFAYPYFVAVTDAEGNILSKEIFAASVAYGRKQNEMTQQESIFQNMPFPDPASGQIYNVIVGFQLTQSQLTHNQRSVETTSLAPSSGTQ